MMQAMSAHPWERLRKGKALGLVMAFVRDPGLGLGSGNVSGNRLHIQKLAFPWGGRWHCVDQVSIQ